MDKKHRYSAGMLAAALIVGIGIGFCGGFAVGGHTGSRQQNMAAGTEQNFETGDLSMEESQKTESGNGQQWRDRDRADWQLCGG